MSVALALAVSDHQDGTGATAAVTGAEQPDGVLQLYAQEVTGDLGSEEWQFVGDREGDGAIEAPLPVGYYWWHARERPPHEPLGGEARGWLFWRTYAGGE